MIFLQRLATLGFWPLSLLGTSHAPFRRLSKRVAVNYLGHERDAVVFLVRRGRQRHKADDHEVIEQLIGHTSNDPEYTNLTLIFELRVLGV